MTFTFDITYMPCQTCHARMHCDDCEKRLEEALWEMEGIRSASVQMGAKQVEIHSTLDKESLEEVLEDLGIFID